MLNLHKDCIETLVKKVGEALKDVRVIHQNCLDPESLENLLACEKVLPSAGLRERLEDYIGDSPLSHFLFAVMTDELTENHDYTEDSAPQPLSEFGEYRDIRSVAKRLVEQFNSLPWEYTVSIQLNDSLKHLAKNFAPFEKFAGIIKLLKLTDSKPRGVFPSGE